MSGATLIFRDGQVQTLKDLLAFHSPVFDRMLNAEKFQIRVEEFDVSLGHRFIRYMESGNVFQTTFWEDVQLYLFADKYLMNYLFKKCSHLLFLHYMNGLDMSDIEELADLCNDILLKTNISRFKNFVQRYKHVEEFKELFADAFNELLET